ncbi:MAG: FAD-binding oxidoreductase, partial [Massilia sp.]
MTDDFLRRCREIVGAGHVLDRVDAMAPHLTDWRGRFTGKARAVLQPGDTGQVAQLVQACNAWRVPIVPQGGRTG